MDGHSASSLRLVEGISEFRSCMPLAFEEKIPCLITWSLFSDQTPTPTRFLKNCEEVGLFSELDCSLEHEFINIRQQRNTFQIKGQDETPEEQLS